MATEKRDTIEAGHVKIEDRIGHVTIELRDSLVNVLAALPHTPQRPVDLARSLGINQDLSGKILSVTRTSDPMAAAFAMPGSEALRSLVRAASRKHVEATIIEAATNAVQQFDNLVRHTLGGRSQLEAVISACLPDARTKFELTQKRAIFGGASNLIGAVADLGIQTGIFSPAKSGDTKCDITILYGLIRLKRLRPGVSICLNVRTIGPEGHQDAHFTLDGQRVNAGTANTLLREFCSKPVAELDIREIDRVVQYLLKGDRVGLESSVDLFFGELIPAFANRYQPTGGPRKVAATAEVEVPTKTLVFDLLVHEDLWPGQDPALIIYNTTKQGWVSVNDPTQDIRRLDLLETVEFLGTGLRRCRISEFSGYGDLLHQAFDQLHCDQRRFRYYRCRVQYPFYGSQISLTFDPPERPAQPTLNADTA